jgi:hypothetical protein
VSLYFDAARMRWYRYVVNWSLRDQVQLAASVHRQAADARVALSWPRDWRVSRQVLSVAGLAVVVALLWWLRRHGHVLPRSGPVARMPAFYERALRLVARRGLAPDAAETARQFASRVGEREPDRAAAFGRLTGYYERARFGDASLSHAERQDVARSLAALGRRS